MKVMHIKPHQFARSRKHALLECFFERTFPIARASCGRQISSQKSMKVATLRGASRLDGRPGPRVTDAHLRGYHRSEPGWITGRISCLIVATEIARMASGPKGRL